MEKSEGAGRWKNQFFPSTPVHANEQEVIPGQRAPWSPKSNESVPNCYRRIVSFEARRHSGESLIDDLSDTRIIQNPESQRSTRHTNNQFSMKSPSVSPAKADFIKRVLSLKPMEKSEGAGDGKISFSHPLQYTLMSKRNTGQKAPWSLRN
ncbi:hypothetical protein CEXT_436881 [Caerostris extrusa]|uniref:Uncharacterized protein n=1 Tax=Caerostris extrusa TaxID=172846 RepID=A0AAV4XE31_CAEEX|nr:hypothetical protein CEXT_436881 [Caerostris extrusa]